MEAKRRGYLFPVVVVILVVFWALLELLAVARERARRRKCHSTLWVMSHACFHYVRDFEALDRDLPHLNVLYPSYIPDFRVFLCPSAGKATLPYDEPGFSSDNYKPAMFGDTHTDYVFVSGLRATDPPDYVLAFDDEWNHDGQSVNVFCIGCAYDCWRDMRPQHERLNAQGRKTRFIPPARGSRDDPCWRDIKSVHEHLAKQEKELAAQGRTMKIHRPAWSSWPDPPPGGWPWYATLGGRAVAVGAFVAFALALPLVVRKVRRGREDGGPGNVE